MDFLRKHEKTLKPGNLAFTIILVVASLGINAYLYTKLGGNTSGSNSIVQPSSSNSDPVELYYQGVNYDLMASSVAALVTCGIVTGALLAKLNNDHLGGRRTFETTFLFIMVLIILISISLMVTPREKNGDSDGESDEQDNDYEAVILSLTSILLGMVCVMTGMAKEYTVLGTSFWFMVTVIALGLTANNYNIATNQDNVSPGDDHKLGRKFTDNEKSCSVAVISMLSIVAFLGFVHMFMEGRSFSKLTGVSYRIERSPYRKSSPRRSSPRRKLTSLKPKRK